MELIIILLIAVEVVIVSSTGCPIYQIGHVLISNVRLKCLIRDGPELWHMAKDSLKNEPTNAGSEKRQAA